MTLSLIEIMKTCPVIPVIAIDEIELAVPLAKSLVEGGIRVLEVTLRTKHGLPAIRAISQEVEGAIVGVGTITQPEEFEQSLNVGACFAVSPGLTPELVAAARQISLPLLPGVMTPSEIMSARNAGFKELKLFPAVPAGGVGMLNALAGPFPDVTFCPTGGVTDQNAKQILACKNVACVGGSWLTPKDLVLNRQWETITNLARYASELVWN